MQTNKTLIFPCSFMHLRSLRRRYTGLKMAFHSLAKSNTYRGDLEKRTDGPSAFIDSRTAQ